MTVTGPYVNKTLFEQAGVDLLAPGATWAEWADAANAVASKLDIPIPWLGIDQVTVYQVQQYLWVLNILMQVETQN
jgi:ABC-type glycerol-3-phosphate transport system substrate-binding protein